MKRILLITLVLFISSTINQSYSQVGNYLKNKAKQAATRSGQKADEEVTDEMNKKVDKGVEKTFNKLFSSDDTDSTSNQTSTSETNPRNETRSSQSSKSSSNAMQSSMLKAFGLSGDVNVEDNYQYKGNIRMGVQSWDGDGSTDGEIDYYTYTTDNNSGFAIQFEQPDQGKVTMIFDPKNQAMIILSDDGSQKSGMVTPYNDSEEVAEESSGEKQDDIEDYSYYNENLKKTGRSKNIAGYKCDEYSYEDEESTGSVWMTKDLPASLWSKMMGANVFAAGSMGYYGGFVMEMENKEKNSGERSYMVVKEVNENKATSLTTSGYQLISLGAVPEEE